ncbi:MAG: T9SS type A sorting domain-containing protein [Dysgonamonadaceae bacterium]|jgi:O-glycosyl hydrolase|nr:T9SS type A sorting domain-containing protein [Dysgonamonadaceae bacterium]
MKKSIWILSILISSLTGGINAQTVLGNFETGGVSPSFSIEESSLTTLSVVDNPSKTGLNTTNKALYGKTVNTAASWWAGIKLDLNAAVTVGSANRYLHVLVKTTLPLYEFVLFGGAEKWMGKYNPSSTDWFDYVVDMNEINGQSLSAIRIALHLDQSAQYNKEIWVDEIQLSDSPDPRSLNVSYTPVTIDAGTQYQTIEGFAASDCWMGNFVGKWSGNNKATVAKYLFSQNLKSDGSPEGAGLSMWRVNLGAGTYELGSAANNIAASDPNYLSRRAECFLNDITVENVYNWNKCAGQQYFLEQAKNYGCESFVAFSNSPLVLYTKNGQGYSGSSSSANIKSDKYNAYANYMVDVVKHFKDAGYNFTYISPVNEPQWEWNKNEQEGSPWTNAEVKTMVTALNSSISNKNLTGTKILITEAGQWDYTYGQSSHRSGNQIEAFFNSSNANYVGNLTHVAPIIAGHSYWKDKKNSDIKSVRQSVKSKAASFGLDVFQTEWSMMEDSGIDGLPSDYSYIDVALNMAKIIHSDMAYANAASWSFWTAIDMERWSQKNRFNLVRVQPNNNDYPTSYSQLETQGAVTAEPNLWALGNYSFFVRPGYRRIQLTGADDMAALMGTAYISPDNSRIVAVYVNMGASAKKIRTTFSNTGNYSAVSNKMYVTSSSYSLQKYGSSSSESYAEDRELTVPARSVATVVYEMQVGTAIEQPVSNRAFMYPNPLQEGATLNVCLPETMKKTCSFTIYSQSGNLVYSSHSTGVNPLQLELNVPKGVYIIKVQCEGQALVEKLVVN